MNIPAWRSMINPIAIAIIVLVKTNEYSDSAEYSERSFNLRRVRQRKS